MSSRLCSRKPSRARKPIAPNSSNLSLDRAAAHVATEEAITSSFNPDLKLRRIVSGERHEIDCPAKCQRAVLKCIGAPKDFRVAERGNIKILENCLAIPWLKFKPSSKNITPIGSSSDVIPDPRIEILETSEPLSDCRKTPGVRCSKSSKFDARPSSISSVVLTAKAPGTCVFCFADSSGDPEVSDPAISPVTVTLSVSAALLEVSTACASGIAMTATAVMARTLNLAMSSPINRAPEVASQTAIRFARNQASRKTCGHLLGQAVCSKRCA